jgi:tRNA pseudouridine65 synthase
MNNIIYNDKDIILIDKPPSYHVHPPETGGLHKVPREKILIYHLQDHFNQKVYPIHRLDVSTTGLLLFATSSEAARNLQLQWQSGKVKKQYLAVIRGWPIEGHFEINEPLTSETSLQPQEARTKIEILGKTEIENNLHPKFKSSRYSLLRASPHTGRYHQIRRHLSHLSFPIIGDSAHGDSRHNKYFREQLNIAGLCLRANQLSFHHPSSGEALDFTAPVTEKWKTLFDLFGACF